MNDLPRPSAMSGDNIQGHTAELDMEDPGAAVIFDVHGFSSGTIDTSVVLGSFSSGVLTVERGNIQNGKWFALATPVTINSEAITAIPTIDTAYLRVRVSTANGADGIVRVGINARL